MLQNNINVYWASKTHSLTACEPDTAIKDLSARISLMTNGDPNGSIDVKRCPAVIGDLRNTYRVRSPLKYNLKWDGIGYITSSLKSQQFYDENVRIRDIAAGLLTLDFGLHMFFTDAPSLIIEQRHARYSLTSFSKNTSMVEGSFDIGKWIRPLDCAFFINNPNVLLEINHGDPLYYIKFYTDKKIIFHKFMITAEIDSFIKDLHQSRRTSHDIKFEQPSSNGLEKYYYMFQQSMYKKHIIKLIKQNILD